MEIEEREETDGQTTYNVYFNGRRKGSYYYDTVHGQWLLCMKGYPLHFFSSASQVEACLRNTYNAAA